MVPPSASRRRPQGFDLPVYLEHLMGLAVLLAWRARWETIGGGNRQEGPVFSLGLLPSQRFAVGFPTARRYGRHPFLAVQADEAMFFRRIAWSSALVDVPGRRLVLITRKVLGDGENVEDIPAMGVALGFDRERKLELLAAHRRMAVRSLWFDEEGPHVATGAPMVALPLSMVQPGQDLFPAGACSQERSLADLVAQRLAATPSQYQPYQGLQVPVPGAFRDLVEPFRPDQVPLVRPKD